MFAGEITMNHNELKRLEIIQKVVEKRLKQREAALILDCSVRNIKLLVKRYKTLGPPGLVSRQRGKPSNRALPEAFKQQITDIIKHKYTDFGPTLAVEMLYEREGLIVSRETARQWMIGAEIWIPKIKKRKKSHPPRPRRENYGSLIQIDGSPHDWFEGRSPKCTLIVFIDDSTSRIQLLRFFPAETTFAYFNTMQLYIERYGLPMAAYSDKHSIFRVNHKDPKTTTGLTQFGRGMVDIGVQLIHANSPQAKGKVENRNRTLQDRLIKTMRLDGIDNMKMANGEYLDKFTERFNAKFAKEPLKNEDIHQKINNIDDLKLHFTLQEERKVSKNLTISYKGKTVVIEAPDRARRLYQAYVTVCETESGNLTVLYKGESLPIKVYTKAQYYSEAVSRKELDGIIRVKPRRSSIPSASHPWRHVYF